MYRIRMNFGDLTTPIVVLTLLLAVLVGGLYLQGAPVEILGALVLAYPVLLFWLYANQYLGFDLATNTVSKPSMLFFRACCGGDTVKTSLDLKDKPGSGKKEYLLNIETEFGKFSIPLASYEEYVTILYQKTMAALTKAPA